MRALRYTKGKLALWNIPNPEPQHGEALVRVHLAGICATDIEIVKGYMGFEGTLGHEFVGVVDECEEAPELVGERVVGEINVACGNCQWCRRGLQRHCSERTVLGISGRDGAFAEYLTLPAWNLHTVPDGMDDRAAVFTEPLAAAFEILDQVHLRPDDAVLVIGDGRLAQLIVRVLSRGCCRVEVVGISEQKLRRMKGFVTRAYLNRPPPGTRYPTVIEASGSPKGWATAIEAVEPRGTIILKSTYAGGEGFDPAALVIGEITVVGSRCGDFKPALRALSDGLDPTPLIDAEFTLEEWPEAFRRARRKDTLKVILRIADD